MYTKPQNHAQRMEKDKLKNLEQQLFDLEKAYDKGMIDLETYIRQRSVLLMKKNNAEERSNGKSSNGKHTHFEFIKYNH